MKTLFLRTSLPLVVAMALVTGVAAGAGSPLKRWMLANMASVLGAQDFTTLKQNFDLLSRKQPSPSYANWAKFAKTGSAAAAKSDGKAAKAACDACHDAYKQAVQDGVPDEAVPVSGLASAPMDEAGQVAPRRRSPPGRAWGSRR